MKKTPFSIAKQTLTTGANVALRLGKTASVAGLSALRVAKGEKPDAYLVKEAFEQMGVTYIKLGQFIASTPSLFPKEYVVAFADCLDQTTPVSFSTIKGVLIDELCQDGRTLEDIFEYIDPTPLASASIAQVHKATLKGGRQVALKVQKPSVGAIMHTDLSVLHGGFWLVEKFMPAMKSANLAPIVDEIRSRMLAETDFLAESRHIDEFLSYLNKVGNTAVTAPTVHKELSTKKVLVMDLLVGRSLVANDWQRTDPAYAQTLMSTVLDTWFLGLMMTGRFHADLHAGNLMLLDDGRVAFLDFGLVGSIKPQSLQACFALVQALQANDYHGMAQAMVDIGMTHQAHQMDTARLASDLQSMLGKMDTNPSQDGLNALMFELVDIGKRHGIHFPKDFALLVKQLLYFDRFMVVLAPEMALFEGQRLKVVEEIGQTVG